MITAYDWMKSAGEQKHLSKGLGRVFKARGNDKKVCFRAKICEKDLLVGKTLMIWIST